MIFELRGGDLFHHLAPFQLPLIRISHKSSPFVGCVTSGTPIYCVLRENMETGKRRVVFVGSEEARVVGTRVRVLESHRVVELRGMLGKVADTYGGEEFMAVDVRLSNGQRRLFWPGDLEEAPESSSPSRSWWVSLLQRR